MNTEFYTFGEILWDCLPSGRHAGGAPFNVAAHIAQLGVSVSLLSAVGQDPLGDEIVEIAKSKGVSVEFVSRARIGLPTGTVIATVDALGNLTIQFLAADMSMSEVNTQSVQRSFVIDWSYNSGSSVGRHQVNFILLALAGA